ncbi:MAG: hypothetical protein EBR09_02225 [Proteobacteria bacterium]|nr:hypothetical protein [Pseudomonadota bacterium]
MPAWDVAIPVAAGPTLFTSEDFCVLQAADNIVSRVVNDTPYIFERLFFKGYSVSANVLSARADGLLSKNEII